MQHVQMASSVRRHGETERVARRDAGEDAADPDRLLRATGEGRVGVPAGPRSSEQSPPQQSGDLQSLYESLEQSWTTGRGVNFKIE